VSSRSGGHCVWEAPLAAAWFVDRRIAVAVPCESRSMIVLQGLPVHIRGMSRIRALFSKIIGSCSTSEVGEIVPRWLPKPEAVFRTTTSPLGLN
jgi:hypothetical protein